MNSISYLLQGRREDLFKKSAKYRKFFNIIMKNDAKLTDEDKARTMFERQFLANLFEAYLKILNSIPREGNFEIILIFFFFFLRLRHC